MGTLVDDLDPWYIWQNQSGDYLVRTKASLGVMNDREYIAIHGSDTGIPLDECMSIHWSYWPDLDSRHEDIIKWNSAVPS
jgi:hypothetical protein